MDAPAQLKYLAQYLDPHLLHHLLARNAPSQSESIRSQLKASFPSANEAQASKREQEASAKAQKLMTLL